MSSSPAVELDLKALVNRARRHISVLAEEIGARPAGSPAERQAFDYAAGLLAEWGYRLERQSIAFAPLPRLSLPVMVAALAMGLSGWLIRPAPWLAIWLPLLLMVLPQWSRSWLRRRKPTRPSENLFAQFDEETCLPPDLIFCAHMDTAAALPFRREAVLKLYSRGMDIFQRIAWMIAALCALQLYGWETADFILYPVALLGSLGGMALAAPQLLQLTVREADKGKSHATAYSPGANDNASGVGVLLAVAEAITRQKPGCRVAFLFTGAEETGLFGAQAFAAAHESWKDHSAIVCLDMVGRGKNLYYVAKEGVFFPLYTSEQVNDWVKRADEEIKPIWYTLRSGDFAAFRRAGFRAASLQSGGNDLADWTYHSLYDTGERIDPNTLENVIRTLQNMIHP